MPSTAEWLDRYYADYAKQIQAAGGSPVDRTEWESHISGNAADIDPTAKKYLSTSLDQLRAKKDADDLKAREQAEKDATQAANEKYGNELIGRIQGEQAGSEDALLKALNANADEQFRLDQPEILEDLSARNLLHSSGVGTALAKRKGELNTAIANAMMAKKSNDINDIINLQKEMYGNYTGLNEKDFMNKFGVDTAGLEREYSLEDYMNQFNDATKMATDARDAQQRLAEQQLINSIIGGVAQGGTMALTGGLMGGGKVAGKATTTTAQYPSAWV